MTKPHLEVLGVYRLNVTKSLIKRQYLELYDYEMPEAAVKEALLQCIEQLHSVVLFEILVRQPDTHFSVTDFTQELAGFPRDSWQAAWCAVFLAADGESILDVSFGETPGCDEFRIAFFLHYYP